MGNNDFILIHKYIRSHSKFLKFKFYSKLLKATLSTLAIYRQTL